MKPFTDPAKRNGILTWEVPELTHPQAAPHSCAGCVFDGSENLVLTGNICRWDVDHRFAAPKTCLINRSIFIEATPEGLAEYVSAILS